MHRNTHIMKRYTLALLVLVAVALGVIGCRTCAKPAAWEYKTQRIYLHVGDIEGFKKSLDDLGREGWSLVSLTPLQSIESPSSGSPQALIILKRPKQ